VFGGGGKEGGKKSGKILDRKKTRRDEIRRGDGGNLRNAVLG